MSKAINRGKRSKKLSEVKPVKKISNSFIEMIHVQKEVLLSHKLEDHEYK